MNPRVSEARIVGQDVLILIISGLFVSPLAWWLQQGSRKQRRRREIMADLDLYDRIRESRPAAAERLNRRIECALDRYVPARPAPPTGLVGLITGVTALGVLIPFLPDEPLPLAVQLLLGGALGALANVGEYVSGRIADARAARAATATTGTEAQS